MGWPEKMSGWVSPDGFIDRAFWKPSTDRNQLADVCMEMHEWANENDHQDIHLTVERAWADADYEPTAALEAIVQAHKNQKEG